MSSKPKDYFWRIWAVLMVGAVSWLAWTIQHSGKVAWAQKDTPMELTLEKLTIVNSAGEKRIELKAEESLTSIQLFDGDQTGRVAMKVLGDGTSGIATIGPNGKGQAYMEVGPDGTPWSAVGGKDGKGQAWMTVKPDGTPWSVVSGSGAHFVTRNAASREIWRSGQRPVSPTTSPFDRTLPQLPTAPPTPRPRSGGSPNVRLLEGARITADDGQFLGKITRNKFSSDSIANEFGTHGSKFSSTSILNKFSTYGGEFSSLSPFNKFTSTPPKVTQTGNFVGYLTVNRILSPRIDPYEVFAYLDVEIDR